MISKKLKISKYAQNLLKNSTCCHTVHLKKDKKTFVGIYDGLSYWGRVENYEGEFVEELTEETTTNSDGLQYLQHFSEESFTRLGGYEVIK